MRISDWSSDVCSSDLGGIKTVLIPKDNEKDLVEIPDNVKKGLQIIPVSTCEEVLKHALTAELKPIEWNDVDDLTKPAVVEPDGDVDREGVEIGRAHV